VCSAVRFKALLQFYFEQQSLLAFSMVSRQQLHAIKADKIGKASFVNFYLNAMRGGKMGRKALFHALSRESSLGFAAPRLTVCSNFKQVGGIPPLAVAAFQPF